MRGGVRVRTANGTAVWLDLMQTKGNLMITDATVHWKQASNVGLPRHASADSPDSVQAMPSHRLALPRAERRPEQ